MPSPTTPFPVFPRLAIILCAVLIGSASLSASDASESWSYTYHLARTDEQRLPIMERIAAVNDPDLGPLIAESLDKLFASRIETTDEYATSTRVALARLLVRQVGTYKLVDEENTVLAIYREVTHPLLKADSAVALGRLGAANCAELFARDLTDLNLRPEQGRSSAMEAQAFGLVQALELLRAPEGYAPVFFASLGWYSPASQVRDIARTALATITADPSVPLRDIIENDAAYGHKIAALKAAAESKAPAASKSTLARLALDVGLSAHESTQVLMTQLAQLRLDAIKLLVDNRDQEEASVALYARVLDNFGAPLEELISTYAALGANASPAATNLLQKRLGDFNYRQKNGTNTPSDRRLVMQIIASLKDTKAASAKPVLVDAQFSNYDGAVIRAARQAAETLP